MIKLDNAIGLLMGAVRISRAFALASILAFFHADFRASEKLWHIPLRYLVQADFIIFDFDILGTSLLETTIKIR